MKSEDVFTTLDALNKAYFFYKMRMFFSKLFLYASALLFMFSLTKTCCLKNEADQNKTYPVDSINIEVDSMNFPLDSTSYIFEFELNTGMPMEPKFTCSSCYSYFEQVAIIKEWQRLYRLWKLGRLKPKHDIIKI